MFRFFYEKMKVKSPLDMDKLENDDIIENGLNEKCPVCVKVIEFFVTLYGAAAGNLAILTMPTGGLYLLGGVSIALENYILKKNLFHVYKYKFTL